METLLHSVLLQQESLGCFVLTNNIILVNTDVHTGHGTNFNKWLMSSYIPLRFNLEVTGRFLNDTLQQYIFMIL